jgi:hypothetical protein
VTNRASGSDRLRRFETLDECKVAQRFKVIERLSKSGRNLSNAVNSAAYFMTHQAWLLRCFMTATAIKIKCRFNCRSFILAVARNKKKEIATTWLESSAKEVEGWSESDGGSGLPVSDDEDKVFEEEKENERKRETRTD